MQVLEADTAFAAFERCYLRERVRLERYCERLIGDVSAAGDVAQESFARAWGRRGDFESDEHLRRWLYRVAHNLCVDVVKGRRRYVPVGTLPDRAADEPTPYEDLAALRLAFRTLSARDRRLLDLRFTDDLSYAEVGGRLSLSLAAARVGVFRAKHALRRRMLADDDTVIDLR
jgi:RNA polymerase sigma-70 factor (ECF subfamily)